ncbi:MAG TPA: anti-sigma factor [Chloroflexota bacterium]|nr:anti-sigma factor [Chloroflexota bacterium]
MSAESVEHVPALPDLRHVHTPLLVTEDERLAIEGHAAAYSLSALNAEETEAFERHLEACLYCEFVVAEFTEATGYLSTLVEPVDATSQLKERLLAAAAAEEANGANASPVESTATKEALPVPPPVVAPAKSWWPQVAAWVAAPLLVATLGLGFWSAQLWQASEAARGRAAAYEATLAAAASGRVVPLAPSGSGAPGGRVALIAPPENAAGQEARLVLVDLPEAPPGRTYQLWLIAGGTPRSAGTFQGSEDVRTVSVQGDPRQAQVVAVTVEPRGGSPAPTSQPILVGQL